MVSPPMTDDLRWAAAAAASHSVLIPEAAPAPVPPLGVLSPFLRHARERPDAPYLDYVSHGRDVPARSESFSRREYAAAVRGAVDLLVGHGVGRGDGVGLLMRSSPEAFALYLGALAIGARVVPLDVQATADELAYPVRMVAPRVLLVRPDQAVLADAVALSADCAPAVVAVPVGAARAWADASAPLAEADVVGVDLDEVAVIVFTSGTTTARPKGVMLTRRNLVQGPQGFADALGVVPEDRVLVVTPMHHVNALQFGMGSTLTHGASLCLVDRFSAQAFWPTVLELRPTVLWTMGGILSILLSREESAAELEARGLLRAVFAAAVGSAYEEVRRRVAPIVMDCYGLSEFSGGTWTLPGRNGADDSVAQSVGLPLPHLTLAVVDAAGRPVPRGATGEVVAVPHGGNVMAGYLGEPELNEAVFRDGLLWSGDLAFVGPSDGQLHFVGRSKDMIRRGGVNISAMEVENVLLGHPAVVDCAVVPGTDDVLGEIVVAFVCLAETESGPRPGTEELRAHCRSVLSEHKVPARIEVFKALPRTATGKVIKRVLLARAARK